MKPANCKGEGDSIASVSRSTEGLREAMFDELDLLRQGKSDVAKSNAMSKLCSVILDSVRIELEVRKYLQKAPDSDCAGQGLLGPAIELSQ